MSLERNFKPNRQNENQTSEPKMKRTKTIDKTIIEFVRSFCVLYILALAAPANGKARKVHYAHCQQYSWRDREEEGARDG